MPRRPGARGDGAPRARGGGGLASPEAAAEAGSLAPRQPRAGGLALARAPTVAVQLGRAGTGRAARRRAAARRPREPAGCRSTDSASTDNASETVIPQSRPPAAFTAARKAAAIQPGGHVRRTARGRREADAQLAPGRHRELLRRHPLAPRRARPRPVADDGEGHAAQTVDLPRQALHPGRRAVSVVRLSGHRHTCGGPLRPARRSRHRRARPRELTAASSRRSAVFVR